MSKYSDITALLDWAMKQKAEKKTSRTKNLNSSDLLIAALLKNDAPSITDLLHKKLEEADMLKKLLDDHQKAHKKEDKKEMSVFHIATLLILFAAVAPLYLRMIIGH